MPLRKCKLLEKLFESLLKMYANMNGRVRFIMARCVCKLDSVASPPIELAGDHLSCATYPCITMETRFQDAPTMVLLQVGFTQVSITAQARALLPHVFTLALQAVFFLWHFPWLYKPPCLKNRINPVRLTGHLSCPESRLSSPA